MTTPGSGGDAPRFAADAMLGGLARWLRALGYDVTWEAGIDDGELVRRAAAEGRWVLTRDVELAARHGGPMLLRVRADAPLDQVREVAARVPLGMEGAFTRCTRCNTPLDPLAPDDVRIPADVRAARRPAWRCASCGRTYWEGSHTARMRRSLAAALSTAGGDGGTAGVPP